MSASILGIGPVCALGCGVAHLREGLTGARRPAIEQRECDLPGGSFSLPVFAAGSDELERFVAKRALRRMDPFVRMALLSAYLAVEDAGIVFPDLDRVGVVLGSGYGPLQTTFAFQDSLIDFGDKCASPTHFANSVHNALASQVSISMNLRGPGQTVTTFGLTTAGAFLTALMWIERGDTDFVLVGAGDEFCPVRGYAEGRMSAEAGIRNRSGGAIRPFAFDECTYTPGEGFVTLLLGKRDSERRYAGLSRVVMGRGALEDDTAENSAMEGGTALLNSLDAVVLAANGNRAEGVAYRRFAQAVRRAAAYSPLYGSMPTGDAFDAAIAALSLKEGRLFPSPEDRNGNKDHKDNKDGKDNKDNKDDEGSSEEMFPGGSIGCLKCGEDGSASLILLAE